MAARPARELIRLLDRRWALVKGIAILAGLLALSAGFGGGVDRLLRIARDEIRMHPASGEIAIVEIDARSLGVLDEWPWPRRHHAALVDRLRQADARLIAFDVAFSARSRFDDDAAFAAALARAGGTVVLPTFRQYEGSGSSNIIENMPLNIFAQHAFLAGVNVVPEADGYVRQIPLGTETAGTPRPSLASLVAEGGSGIDGMLDIDFAIDPSTIPRFSFVDVIAGRVPPEAIRGKRIMVGATAIDMGDRYAVPVHGVIPGVVIQALAAETMLAGPLPGTGSALWPLLLAALVAALAVRPGRRIRRALIFAGGSVLVLALPLATEQLWAVTFPLVPALALLATAVTGTLALHLAERFRQRTYTDAETGLPNLPALTAALEEHADGLAVVARIDRFAAMAAALGSDASVALFQRLADRLRQGEDRTIYRVDEHSLAWISRADEEEELERRFGGLAALMRTPIECGRLVDVALTFGVAEACLDSKGRTDAKQQVANAALAAERAGKAQLVWIRFSATAGDQTDWHLSLLGELDAAMAAGEVWNAYQPKLDVKSGRVCGVEALVRWSHRERGRVGPDEFIPLVEASGRAADLTAHVFDAALADALRWRRQGHDLQVAVNVSATLLGDAGFLADLRARLEASPLPADRVTIEVTESAAMTDPDKAAAALEEWRALGVNVSIDDYGTGQSSLGYLQKLPATELKIDKSFVQSIVEDHRNAIMVRSTIALAHQLGMKVVAEGVETQAALDLLSEMECDIAQGWLIARPMPAADLEDYLATPRAIAA